MSKVSDAEDICPVGSVWSVPNDVTLLVVSEPTENKWGMSDTVLVVDLDGNARRNNRCWALYVTSFLMDGWRRVA